ncbi:MAG: SRPBCC domain-containing protein [Prevotella sp.]|jgi:uncharacterized protein YndB with AHSA1/START domain|nr:SRPBCC domain-containing protein [Prevotella sp.]
MKKQKLAFEYALRSNSENIIWALISTESGLHKWIADMVESDGDSFTFTWGDPDHEHETRRATIEELVKNSHIRLRWDDDEDEEAYWEIRMVKSDLTNDYLLEITDFALAEDVESLRDIWDQNYEELHRNTGL